MPHITSATWSEFLSASLNTATDWTAILRAVLNTLHAISPRFATRILSIPCRETASTEPTQRNKPPQQYIVGDSANKVRHPRSAFNFCCLFSIIWGLRGLSALLPNCVWLSRLKMCQYYLGTKYTGSGTFSPISCCSALLKNLTENVMTLTT